MNLEFLQPATAGSPPARSPLADPADSEGAITELRDGWEVAVSYGDPEAEAQACGRSVGFVDLSYITKFEIQGSSNAVSTVLGSGGVDCAGGSTLGLARRSGRVWRCPLTSTKGLVLCDPEVRQDLGQELSAGELRVCELTCAWGAMAIIGPLARELFARFCAIDLRESVLPVNGFRPGSVARTPGYVLREDPDRFLMLFGAAYGAYMWEVVADAADHLGGRPAGADVLPGLDRGAQAVVDPVAADAGSGEGAERA